MSPNEILDSCKDQFEAFVVAGFDKDGNLHMKTHPDNAVVAHWILNRALFDLSVFEKQRLAVLAAMKAQKAEAGEAPKE